eukprot:350636-Chlamydomonas_euryale.AAC.2
MVGAVASKYGFFNNAAETVTMMVGQHVTLLTFKLSGKQLLVTDSVKYFKSFIADGGSMSREMDVRNVHALAAFHQFQNIGASRKPNKKPKMDVYRTFIRCMDRPILSISLHGCKMWTWTEVQMGRLEVTGPNCLRGIVGVKLIDCHRFETI